MAQQDAGDAVHNVDEQDAGDAVHHVDENEFKNMRLSIGTVGKTMVQISLSDNLNDTKNIDVRLHNGPQAAGGAVVAQGNPRSPQQGGLPARAAPGEAAPPQGRLKITVAAEHDADKEYLDKMRGWLMTVATLFVNMTFQAVLHPPDWFKTEWYNKHGKAGSPVAAPAPSPHTADATSGEVWRALLYLLSNIVTFGTALALVLVLLWETPTPRLTMKGVRFMMPFLSLFLAFTLALGASDNWAITAIVCVVVVGYAHTTVRFSRRFSKY